MLSLTSVNDSITLVTSNAISTDWVVTYGDETSSGFTPGSNQGNVATAATTTIVAAPAASTQRNIKSVIITNRGVSDQIVQLFKVYSGTSYAITEAVTLTAGQNFRINQDGRFYIDLATSSSVSTFYLGTTAVTTNQATGTIPSLSGVSVTGSAASVKSPATTGVAQLTGMGTGTTRVKTVRDANDTVLELGGDYTPTGTWVWTSASVTWPTFNQSTSGSAGTLKSVATTGLMSVTGMGAGTTRAKTVRDADDTILELGGSYTPGGVWNWTSATVTWPTFNQSTSGSAASLKSPSTTGVMQVTGMTIGTTRVKTVSDANDTILELGGSYSPSGIWNFGVDVTINTVVVGGTVGGVKTPIQVAAGPSAPAAGSIVIYSDFFGKGRPAFIASTGRHSSLQPSLGKNSFSLLVCAAGGTTFSGISASWAYGGTTTARNWASTNVLTRQMSRVGQVSASGSTGQMAALYFNAAFNTIGDGSGIGGFRAALKFGASDASVVAAARQFVGMTSSTSAPTNVNPGALTNVIGVGADAADTTLHIYYGGSAAQTPIDLGANFPCDTNTECYILELHADPYTGDCQYKVYRVGTTYVATGTIANATPGTTLPASTTALCPVFWRSNNTSTSAVGIDFCSSYIEPLMT